MFTLIEYYIIRLTPVVFKYDLYHDNNAALVKFSYVHYSKWFPVSLG